MKYLVIETNNMQVPEIFKPLYLGESKIQAKKALLSQVNGSFALFEWYDLGKRWVFKSKVSA